MAYKNPKRAEAYFKRHQEKLREYNKNYYHKNKKQILLKHKEKFILTISRNIGKDLKDLKELIRETGRVHTWDDLMDYLLKVNKEYERVNSENFKLKLEKQKWTHNTSSN